MDPLVQRREWVGLKLFLYISSKSVLHFLPFMESLFARFGILVQISLPRVLDSPTAKMFSLWLFISSSKMDLEPPVEYCGICWLKGDVFSHFNFLGSWVDDVNTLCWSLPGSVCSSSHHESDPVKEKESGVSVLHFCLCCFTMQIELTRTFTSPTLVKIHSTKWFLSRESGRIAF